MMMVFANIIIKEIANRSLFIRFCFYLQTHQNIYVIIISSKKINMNLP